MNIKNLINKLLEIFNLQLIKKDISGVVNKRNLSPFQKENDKYNLYFEVTLLEVGGGNPKGDLQHLCQTKYNSLPDYSVVSRHGPDHSPEFIVEVSINGKRIGEGKGSSLAEAERKAAQAGIRVFETKH